MKSKAFWVVAAIVAAAVIAAGYVAIEAARREAFIHRCNEEGAGGMFTSREYCEDLYVRGVALDSPAQSSN